MGIKVEGLRELSGQLLELQEVGTARKALRRAARKAFKPVEADARMFARVAHRGTGKSDHELADSIRLATKVPKRGAVVLSIGLTVGKRKIKDEVTSSRSGGTIIETRKVDASWRWHFTEFGTPRRAAAPFLRPALHKNKEQVIATFKAELGREVDKAIRKKARG